jgi:hypothetical protein
VLAFHPYADIFPLIQGEEFAGLVADIKANGLREKIVVLDGSILDGRNRYLASVAAGLIVDDELPDDRPLVFQRFVLAVDGDALKFVVSKNIHRRHLSVGQRSYAMAEYEKLRHGGARKPDQDANLQLEPPPETRADLAEKGHVSERSIASAAVVRDSGVEELKAAVKQGEIAVSAAEQIARMPQAQQPEALAKVLPRGARAIMGSRQEPDDSLDFFPTPPWATRALIERVFPTIGVKTQHPLIHPLRTAWEPACGEGHMADVLAEYADVLIATDIFDYGYGQIFDFLQHEGAYSADWIITNPPFKDDAEAFVLRAIDQARVGVAMFLRLQWLETIGRYERIFQPHPPAIIAQFAERVPLHKGRYEPDGGTATAYLWIVWLKEHRGRTEFFWIPPGCKKDLTHPDDAERFTAHPVIRKEDFDPTTGEVTAAA